MVLLQNASLTYSIIERILHTFYDRMNLWYFLYKKKIHILSYKHPSHFLSYDASFVLSYIVSFTHSVIKSIIDIFDHRMHLWYVLSYNVSVFYHRTCESLSQLIRKKCYSCKTISSSILFRHYSARLTSLINCRRFEKYAKKMCNQFNIFFKYPTIVYVTKGLNNKGNPLFFCSIIAINCSSMSP